MSTSLSNVSREKNFISLDLILVDRLDFIFTNEIVKEEKTVVYCCFTRQNRENEMKLSCTLLFRTK